MPGLHVEGIEGKDATPAGIRHSKLCQGHDGRVQPHQKDAQIYDPLFGPLMEKVVGITDHYQATVGGLEYDISGRYSSSGRFKYGGP
jgi:hypothetical protein